MAVLKIYLEILTNIFEILHPPVIQNGLSVFITSWLFYETSKVKVSQNTWNFFTICFYIKIKNNNIIIYADGYRAKYLLPESRWLPIFFLSGLYVPQSSHLFFLKFISVQKPSIDWFSIDKSLEGIFSLTYYIISPPRQFLSKR